MQRDQLFEALAQARRFLHRLLRGFDTPLQRGKAGADHEIALVAEVIVECAFRQAGGGGDRRHARVLVAIAQKELFSDFQNAGLALAPDSHGAGCGARSGAGFRDLRLGRAALRFWHRPPPRLRSGD